MPCVPRCHKYAGYRKEVAATVEERPTPVMSRRTGTLQSGPPGNSRGTGPPQDLPAPWQETSAPRRERKKRQTRDALLHAALGLFEAKGYEQTAIHEITDAVDVSERTFFRYFASKEDLVLSFAKDASAALR